MPQRLTTSEFIRRAINVHGSLYDYSKVSYLNAETKVCIICSKHGKFYQIPITHLYGHGCKLCADEFLRKPGLSLEDFISKAIKVHGFLYDYSKVEYKNTRTKICIICPQHGEFHQKPNNHLNGQGCKLCDNQRLSPDQFISKATFMHNDRYTYDMSGYKNTKGKVCIICPEHGPFFQNAENHLRGHGCPACKKIKMKKTQFFSSFNTDIFIEKAQLIHGKDKYDYSKSYYKLAKEKITIICKIHGEFQQEPYKHLRGNGCKKCAVARQTLSLVEFIKKANIAHGIGKYDYSKIKELKNGKEKICIVCPRHGESWQISWNHLQGIGCPRCGFEKLSRDRAMTQEEFIRRADKIHGNKYDYSKVKYVNSITNICIICPIHGKFYQEPGSHLKTRGCPHCKYSLGERAIIRWLERCNIDFEHFYTFPDLLSTKGTPLEFDFYVKHVKILIEYDGEHHFRPVRFNSISEEKAFEKFKKVRYHDYLKNQYCINNKIPLLRIKYKEFDFISNILDEKIQSGTSNKLFINEMSQSELSDYYERCLINGVSQGF